MSGITPVSPVMEMLIGGVWTDITDDVRLNSAHSGGGVKIKRGIPNEGTVAEPTQVDFVLNNAAGKYSPKNAMSVYWGKLGRNTPIRFGMLRRSDLFAHNEADSWGRLPSWVDRENNTILGDKWRLTGAASRFDIAAGEATISSGSGLSAATFGVFGDCEIVTRVKVSNRTSEFGVVMRMEDPAVDEQDFENGLGSWTGTGGTFQLSTVQKHSGTTSGLLTVSGSPANAWVSGSMIEVTPDRQYRLRVWVRCSVARNVIPALEWYNEDQTPLSNTSSTVAVAANTWTLIELDGTAPDEAYYALGVPYMQGSPANGTLLFVDDIEILENNRLNYFSAYVTPGTTDVVRMGRVFPGTEVLNTTVNAPSNIVAGDWWWIKVQWSGIRRRIRYWKDGTDEPTNWLIRNYDIGANDGRWPQPRAGMVGLFAKDGSATVSFDSIQVTVWRAHAEIAELPPRWDLSRQDQWVPISARGITRRLGQGRKSLESPTRLYFESFSSSLKMYAPLESFENDGNTVPNVVGGGVTARSRNLQLGTPDATGTLAMPGIAGYAEFTETDSYLIVKAIPGATAGIWSYFNFFRVPALPSADTVLYQVDASGSIVQWRVILQLDGAIRLEGWTGFGVRAINQATGMYPIGSIIPTGSWVAANLYVFDNGSTITWALNYHRPGTTNFYSNAGSTAGTVGACLGAQYYSNSILTTAGNLSVAHALIYPGDLPFVSADFYRAAYAYIGEECIARWLRVGGNAGILVNTTGFAADSKPMGAQTMDKTLDLMEEAAEVDVSFHMEERDLGALNLRTRESLYNQVPIKLDIDVGHLTEPLEPTDDDQLTRNYVTVKRPNGGSYTSIQTDGPLNVNPPEDDPDGVGVYDEAPEINYFTDAQLKSAANFRRSRGTQDVIRYPSMKIDLNSECYDDDPLLTAAVLALDTGDIVEVTNPEVGYDPILQMVFGYDEFVDQYDYGLTFNTKPADVFTVGVVGYSTRLQTRSQSLAADYTPGDPYMQSTDTSLGGRRWVTVWDSPDSFPFDVLVEGAKWRVHAVGDVRNGTPSLRNGIGTWTQSSGHLYWGRKITMGRKPMWNFGAVLNDQGVTSYIDARDQATVTAGQVYRASTYLRLDGGDSTDCGVDLYWLDAGLGDLGNVGGSGATQTAAAGWVHYYIEGTAPVGAVYARIVPYALIANGVKLYFDDARVIHLGTATGQPQYLSVEPDPVNGVTKQLNNGWAVRVADPWRVAF